MAKKIIVIKKDGSKDYFDINTMIGAISKSSEAIEYNLTDDDIDKISQEVFKLSIDKLYLTPQSLHDIAITATRNAGFNDIATSYKDYHTIKQSQKQQSVEDLHVVKKDGSVIPFDIERIKDAIQSATKHAATTISDTELSKILNNAQYYASSVKDVIATDQLHHIVMGALKLEREDIYKAYKDYHTKRKMEAHMFNELADESESLRYGTYNENANKDSQVITTKAALINEMTMKKLVRGLLKPEWLTAHDEGWIYIHDMGDLYKDTFNCNLFDLAGLMKTKTHDDGEYAFKLNNKTTYEPKHVSTAFDLLSSVTISASGNQFGGFTINTIDTALAPYAEKSYQYYLKEAEQWGIENDVAYADAKTLQEIKQGVQSYTYELAQTQNALGQTPFTTITFGLDTSKWGREITKAFLNDRKRPENIDVFPKLVFFSRNEVNRHPDSPNYDIYQLALECSSTKLYPDYLSLDYDGTDEHYRRDVYERSGLAIGPMGCARGSEFVTWKWSTSDTIYTQSFERFWNTMSDKFGVKTQANGYDVYIEPENLLIKDSHIGEIEFVPVTYLNKNSHNTWKRLKFSGGTSMDLTDDHPLAIIGKGRTYVKDMVVGDTITDAVAISNDLDTGSSISKAWLQGFILCDGNLTENSEVVVSYADVGEDEIRNMIGVMYDSDQLRDTHHQRGVKGNYYDTAIKDSVLVAECREIFGGINKIDRTIPSHIFAESRDIRLAFLAGMIDADGYSNNTKKSNNIQIGSTNRELALGQKLLIESLGYGAKMYLNRYNKQQPDAIRYRIEVRINDELLQFVVCDKKRRQVSEITYPNKRRTSIKNELVEIEDLNIDESSYDVTTESDYFDLSGKVSHNCRAHLSPKERPITGEDVVDGRFNIGAVSINPVKIALESKGDKHKFEQLVKHYSHMIFDIQNWRYERVGNLKGSSNPLFWCEGGAWERIKPEQRVKDSNLLSGATASIGYCGLYEMVNAIKGNDWESVSNEERKQIQAEFLELLNDVRIERSETDDHPYALYSTPAESLVFTWEKLLTKQYGTIDGVTDRDYLTNSFHQPVWIHSNAIDKINFEKDFHQIAKGGHISYAEFDYGVAPTSIEAVVNYAMSKGLYFGVNVVSSVCEDCGTRGDFLATCDHCGSSEILVVERVCGYLTYSKRSGVQAVNDGKWSEIKERVRHSVDGAEIDTKSFAERNKDWRNV